MPQLKPFEEWHSDVLAYMLKEYDVTAEEITERGNFDYRASYERGEVAEAAAVDALASLPH